MDRVLCVLYIDRDTGDADVIEICTVEDKGRVKVSKTILDRHPFLSSQ